MQRRRIVSCLIVGLGVILGVMPGCSGLGRDFNQALPEFLRSEAGADEIQRIESRRRVFQRSAEEKARAKELFNEAEGFFSEERWEAAIDTYVGFLEAYPETEDDALARYHLIQAHLGDDNYTEARKALAELIRRHPVSPYNNEVEEIAFDMAESYLAGEQDAFIFSKKSEGVKILRSLVTFFPNGRFTDDAYWKLGNYAMEETDWRDARGSFQAIIDQHTDSPWSSRAQYNLAISKFEQVKGEVYDEKTMLTAVEDFQNYLEGYPEGDRRTEAAENIARLEDLLAQKQIAIADWYLGQDEPGAARLYLSYCLAVYGETPSAPEARALLETLPEIGPGDLSESLPSDLRRSTSRPILPRIDPTPAALPKNVPAESAPSVTPKENGS